MKKIIVLLFTLSLLSCNTTSYFFENNVQNYGLDLRNGKWILNEIDCPASTYGMFEPLVSENFKAILHDSLFDLVSAKGIILPKKIGLQPNKSILEALKKGTKGYDFFINIRARKANEKMGILDIDNPLENLSNINQSNQCEVVVEVYNLNLSEIIYSKKVTGSNNKSYDSNYQTENGSNSYQVKKGFNSVSFQKNADMIILGCFNKIMRDIKNKSLKQKTTSE